MNRFAYISPDMLKRLISRAWANWLLVLMLLLSVWVLSSCAPKEQEFKVAEQVQERQVAVPFSPREWMPEGEVKAVIIALHGFNDYSNAFDVPARHFMKNGIAVFSYDQRGFGNTPLRGIWAGEKNLTHDLITAVNYVRGQYPSKPVYVMGESMGAAVAVVAATEANFPKVDGLVLVAPAFWGGNTMNGFYRGVLWMLAHTMPSETLTGRDLKIRASDNTPMLRGMGRDPMVLKKTRVDAVYGMVHLMDRAFFSVENVKAPVLLLYGKKDQVIPPQPVFEAVERLKTAHDVVVYPDGFHMLLRDYQADVVLSDITSWILNNRKIASGFTGSWQQASRKQDEAVTP